MHSAEAREFYELTVKRRDQKSSGSAFAPSSVLMQEVMELQKSYHDAFLDMVGSISY